MKDNIVLIGMPGCGKSTLGVVLAKSTNRNFVDVDLLIQQKAGKKLHKIIEDEGLKYFSDLENSVGASVEAENSVIATGGSIIFGEDAMAHLKKIGTVVYLRLPLEVIKKRIRNFATRGIAMKPGETLDDVFAQRSPLYEKYADMTIDCENVTFEENLEKLIQALDK